MKLFFCIFCVFALILGLPRTGIEAAPPWMDFVRFERIEADPDMAYELTSENGPWLIMATTFRGEHAREDAQRLVHELRKKYKLTAYSHRKVYDYSQGFLGRGVDQYGNPRRMQHHANAVHEEVAVLVGNYPSVDDSKAQRDLKRIKSAEPEVLSGESPTSHAFSKYRRKLNKSSLGIVNANKKFGPMRLAFVTANPMLPAEYFRPGGVDQFVEKLNKGIEHSLMACRGRFTVKVATFKGFIVVNPKNIRTWEASSMEGSQLEKGALRAHRLTVALRAKGYEAFEFHDRNSSIVTVGSFDQPPKRSAAGKLVYEPQIRELIQRFGAKLKSPQVLGRPAMKPSIQPEALLGIPFDVHPMVIPIPKRSLSTDFAQPMLSVH